MDRKAPGEKGKLVLLIVLLVGLLAAAGMVYRQLSARVQTIADSVQAQEVAGAANRTSGEPEITQEPASDPSPTPMPAPDFTVYDMDGNAVSLSDFAGKPRLINFWATWCPPCRGELPDFDAAWADYGQDVVFLMVDLTDGARETQETVRQFLSENGYSFPVYLDTDQNAAMVYGVRSIPMTVLVDADGNLYAYQVGAVSGKALRAALDTLLETQ